LKVEKTFIEGLLIIQPTIFGDHRGYFFESFRKDSATYGQHFKIELTEKNKTIFWIPPGFAHGFLTLADDTIFSYKCTDYYNPKAEGSVNWNSPSLKIDWGIENPILSEKDALAVNFTELISPF